MSILNARLRGADEAGGPCGTARPFDSMPGDCRQRQGTKIHDAVITGGNAIPLLGPVLTRMACRPSLMLEGLEMILKVGK